MWFNCFRVPFSNLKVLGWQGGFLFSPYVYPLHTTISKQKDTLREIFASSFFQQFWESSREDSGVTFQV